MSDENEEVAMAECGSCRAIVPIDSSECPECGISFSGVSDEALGECGACNALVPLDSTKCPESHPEPEWGNRPVLMPLPPLSLPWSLPLPPQPLQ